MIGSAGNGSANTGSGGGGGGSSSNGGGSGGSGIVILRYPDNYTIADDLNSLTESTTDLGNGFKVTSITAGTGTVSFTES